MNTNIFLERKRYKDELLTSIQIMIMIYTTNYLLIILGWPTSFRKRETIIYIIRCEIPCNSENKKSILKPLK